MWDSRHWRSNGLFCVFSADASIALDNFFFGKSEVYQYFFLNHNRAEPEDMPYLCKQCRSRSVGFLDLDLHGLSLSM